MSIHKQIEMRLHRAPLVPLIRSQDPDTAIQISTALQEGGLTVQEVVLRTPGALKCLAAIVDSCPGAIVGAGTVLTANQAREAVEAGAGFIVSPGLDEDVVAVARKHELPVFPGIATASEAQHAWNLGLNAVKFFPATLAGGPAMLKALSSVFREMKFMPTGGVSVNNLAEFLAVPSVFACGGSWLTPAEAIARGDFEQIIRLAAEALTIATDR